jgi:hypothetical protein
VFLRAPEQGPLFFNVFINDIAKSIKHRNIYLFTDDLKLTVKVSCIADSKRLQDDIDNLQKRCYKNKMLLNAVKCKHIIYTRKRNILLSEYTITGTKLEEVSTIKDLGVVMDSKLRFSSYLDNIISESIKSLGFILRSSNDFKNPSTVVVLYNSYIGLSTAAQSGTQLIKSTSTGSKKCRRN